MSWVITGTQKTVNGILTLGQSYGGGYFAGYISHTADGNPTHALIVAPKATGASGSGYQNSSLAYALNQNAGNGTNYSSSSIGTVANGAFDGAANMAVFVSIGIANFPAAEFCKNLTIGGFTDWYLPSISELDIAYFNLKPTTDANSVSWGVNAYAVPKRSSNYTASFPAQTNIQLFSTGSEAFAFSTQHWSSTQGNATLGNTHFPNIGAQGFPSKTTSFPVRAFRKIAL